MNVRFGVEALWTLDSHVFTPHGEMDSAHGRSEEGQEETDPALICPQGVTDSGRSCLLCLLWSEGGSSVFAVGDGTTSHMWLWSIGTPARSVWLQLCSGICGSFSMNTGDKRTETVCAKNTAGLASSWRTKKWKPKMWLVFCITSVPTCKLCELWKRLSSSLKDLLRKTSAQLLFVNLTLIYYSEPWGCALIGLFYMFTVSNEANDVNSSTWGQFREDLFCFKRVILSLWGQ